ncbi:stress-induced morphogen [Pseudarthrobacter defluvii]|uniref:hypothetical protein n=1 Tax=Pseudarthrobacter defluvii TaxID=410837 RepID=UPI002785E9FD|nr:hypothetical protein [Pseudarthrobacter defluvii]MDQ0768004.1 stress-induced morphogen [Pseudarthrobacter defluvii]
MDDDGAFPAVRPGATSSTGRLEGMVHFRGKHNVPLQFAVQDKSGRPERKVRAQRHLQHIQVKTVPVLALAGQWDPARHRHVHAAVVHALVVHALVAHVAVVHALVVHVAVGVRPAVVLLLFAGPVPLRLPLVIHVGQGLGTASSRAWTSPGREMCVRLLGPGIWFQRRSTTSAPPSGTSPHTQRMSASAGDKAPTQPLRAMSSSAAIRACDPAIPSTRSTWHRVTAALARTLLTPN